jgi:hypothetical protein
MVFLLALEAGVTAVPLLFDLTHLLAEGTAVSQPPFSFLHVVGGETAVLGARASVTAVPLLIDLAHLLVEGTAVHQTTILLFACCGRGNGRLFPHLQLVSVRIQCETCIQFSVLTNSTNGLPS